MFFFFFFFLVFPNDLHSGYCMSCLHYPWQDFWFWVFICHCCTEVLELVDCFKSLVIDPDVYSDAFCIVCHHFCLFSIYFHAKSFGSPIKVLDEFIHFLLIISQAINIIGNCRLMMTLLPVLMVPARLSRASVISHSRKLLKRVGESKHPCLTPGDVQNSSLSLPWLMMALLASL